MRKNELSDVMRHVEPENGDECRLWLSGTFSGRYGRFFLAGKAILAHRAVYELHNGGIPDDLYVMHKCNNKLCCNPSHLTIGTNSENQRHASMSGAFKTGASGIKGISFDKKRGYWKSNGYKNGKLYNLYTGPSYEKAIAARQRWDKENGITFNIKEL